MSTHDTTLQTDPLVQRKVAAANDAHDNILRTFQGALAAVKVSEPTRDASQNSRYRYEHNWTKLREAATRYKIVARGPILVPRYYAPPSTEDELVEFTG
jgi:hypothetical protein